MKRNDVQSKVAMSQGEVQSPHFLASVARVMQGDAMKDKCWRLSLSPFSR